jgi:hypothetical protein
MWRARRHAYAAIGMIIWLGGFYRRDICRISRRRSAQPRVRHAFPCTSPVNSQRAAPVRQAHFSDRGNDAEVSRSRSRIDKALAEPAVFIEDPAKAALLSSQRGELERILVAGEEEWLRLAGDLDATRGNDNPRGPAMKI